MAVLQLVLTVFAAIITIPFVVLFIESIAAFANRRSVQLPTTLPKTTILMPAHNEEQVIARTLDALRPHLTDSINALVIADNCTDNTVEIVKNYPVDLLERSDQTNRGKGFALDYGLSKLSSDPPAVIVMLDADCTVEANGIAKLVQLAHTTQRPIQAVYLMKSPENPSTKDLISAFAFRVKNLVRPKGLYNLNQPCLLTGSGMAFPWEVIRNAPLASGNIVEDMQLGFDLALDGHSPQLAPDVLVWGELPQQNEAATTQRTRWEHGHLQTLLTQVPRLLKGGLKQKRFDLLALAFDLLIPPLALLVLFWLASGAIMLTFGLLTSLWLPATILGVAGVLLFIAIGLAWVGFGRNDIPLSKLLAIPLYIAWKIPLYLKFLVQRQTAWVRTDRDSAS